MFKKTLFLAAVLSILLACNLQGEQIHSTWVGGARGSWEDAGKWSPAIVPENGVDTFAVTINSGSGKVEVQLKYSHTIDTLSCKGDEVELHGEGLTPVTLTLTDTGYASLTDNGELEITAWGLEVFEIEANVTNSNGGLMDFWGGRIYGDLLNPAGGIIEANGKVGIEGDCQNEGLVIVASYHDFDVDQILNNTGQIRIYGGGCSGGEVLDNNSTGEITGFGIIFGGERLSNKGTISANSGSLVAATGSEGLFVNEGTLTNTPMSSLNIRHLYVLHYDMDMTSDVNNAGIVEVNAGGGVAFDCNMINEPNGVIKLLGGTLAATTITQKADANFAGFGGISGNVIIDNNGLIKLTGSTNIVGDVNIEPNATLQVSDGLTLITGHTTCNNGIIHMKGGYIIPQGGLSNNKCEIIWEPGLYTNVADFNLDGQVNLKDFALFADTWLWQTAWR